MNAHKELDEQLLKTIANMPTGGTFSDLRRLAMPTAEASGRHVDHVLNGRLQHLRKKGLIKFFAGRWVQVVNNAQVG